MACPRETSSFERRMAGNYEEALLSMTALVERFISQTEMEWLAMWYRKIRRIIARKNSRLRISNFSTRIMTGGNL
jgi:hypothetical protein